MNGKIRTGGSRCETAWALTLRMLEPHNQPLDRVKALQLQCLVCLYVALQQQHELLEAPKNKILVKLML